MTISEMEQGQVAKAWRIVKPFQGIHRILVSPANAGSKPDA
jgi:hypothetical protein